MAVPYKLYQNNRTNSTTQGQWYARATHYGILTTDEIVDSITQETTLTDVEVIGVIRALLRHIRTGLRNGKRVRLDKFGSFKTGLKSTPAVSAKAFNPSQNIKSLHVIFQPAVLVNSDKKRYKSMLSGVTVEEMKAYAVDKSEPADDPTDDDDYQDGE
ncbi:MAG: HU family DNA-binding protein [Prevotella sp.]|nr:HU family DNA-binding protein [Prevotella sp.]